MFNVKWNKKKHAIIFSIFYFICNCLPKWWREKTAKSTFFSFTLSLSPSTSSFPFVLVSKPTNLKCICSGLVVCTQHNKIGKCLVVWCTRRRRRIYDKKKSQTRTDDCVKKNIRVENAPNALSFVPHQRIQTVFFSVPLFAVCSSVCVYRMRICNDISKIHSDDLSKLIDPTNNPIDGTHTVAYIWSKNNCSISFFIAKHTPIVIKKNIEECE